MIASFFTNLLGIMVFLFIFWKRLRDDYSAEIIFKSAFDILLGITTSFLISFKFAPNAFLWITFIGGTFGLAVAYFRLKVRFFETFEAFITSVLPWISFIFLMDSALHSSLSSFLGFVVTLMFVFVSYYFSAHYKEFTWYKSGKIGFAGLITLGFIFIARAMLAIFGINVLSLVAFKFEVLLSGVGAITCLVLLFNLGRIKE